MPCGNGRNVFLLAAHFKQITAVDIQPHYLSGIDAIKNKYGLTHVDTVLLDILKNIPELLKEYQLICNIHFFDFGLIKGVLSQMAVGSHLLIETPSCHGGNYFSLPNESEVEVLFGSNEVLRYQFKRCKHEGNKAGRGILKTLIKKR